MEGAQESTDETNSGNGSAELRIICLEEHVVDFAMADATRAALETRFPYFKLSDDGYQDDPDASGQDRPMLQGSKVTQSIMKAPIDDRLAAMDANGIDMQVLSDTNFPQFASKRQGPELTRAANDHLAEIVARYPDRFAGFATLPWQDPDAAVREIDRAVGDLGLAATMLSGHPADDALADDRRFEPLLARLSELRVPLYIHPGPPFQDVQRQYYAGFAEEVTSRFSLAGWGWHSEAGMHVVRLILSGVFDRHRDLQVISGHWGEMVPFFLQRMDDVLPPAVTGLSRTISQTYREHVSVTPSGLLYDHQFEFILKELGADRIMFSVDYPYYTMTGARRWLEKLDIVEDARGAIGSGNAERLLRLNR
ncbi:amidohydrolase family protein [Pararhizobium mangrovi]|uniref:Amidohydrolase n=1 Tax=Pararhizobium mangrovi TaxID=2590452 RepID=A0A506U044_9HYPH|nr:amidohydrolase family protein [Pararhizobium mangrovi]TPW27692.1 amidohydrolase [Pararhizobium mangrovi]